MVGMQVEVLGVYVGKPQLIGETRRGPAATVHATFTAMFFGSALDTGDVGATEQKDIIDQVLATAALAESWRTELAARQNGGRS